jgi:hypothetical protein
VIILPVDNIIVIEKSIKYSIAKIMNKSNSRFHSSISSDTAVFPTLRRLFGPVRLCFCFVLKYMVSMRCSATTRIQFMPVLRSVPDVIAKQTRRMAAGQANSTPAE